MHFCNLRKHIFFTAPLLAGPLALHLKDDL
jgi:hypothetical protein